MIFFDNIVKRVANFSIQSYEENRKDKINFFKTNELFRLSILISSRTLYEDVTKSKDDKIKKSLSKYFIRAHFNPTPFGVFNSVGTVKWGNSTVIKNEKVLALNVKYDSLFLSNHLNSISGNEWLEKLYCINPSIHFLNKSKISFFKSDIHNGDKVEQQHVEIDYDSDLEWLVNRFKKLTVLQDVLNEIILEGFEIDEVKSYLKNVVDCGLIIEYFLFYPYAEKLSKENIYLHSKLVRKDFFILEGSNEIKKFSQQYLGEQDSFFKFENNEGRYSHAVNTYDKEGGTLDFDFKEKIGRYIDFTIQYNSHTSYRNDTLKKFIGKIGERYNDGFIPISKIFNPYSGLTYTSLVESYDLELDKEVLQKILAESEDDIYLNLPINSNKEKKTNKLPASFSVMAEGLICKKTNAKILYIKSLGSSSALNLIARFSDITDSICQEIVDFEKEMNCEKILADINCIGTFRSINVTAKKQFYDFSIPINTSFDDENAILLSDIFVHLNGGEIRLVSQKHKKEILPKITSALNPILSDSEIYRFLCDFEYYNQEIYGVIFNFNSYSYFKPYVPRIYMEENVLLSPAQILLVDKDYTFAEFIKYVLGKIKQHNFSILINIVERQGILVLDTEDEDDLKVLYEKIKAIKLVYISESLYEFFNPIVNDKGNSNYSHELAVGVKNTSYFRQIVPYGDIEEIANNNLNIPIVSDWLYVEAFTNSYSNKDILKYVHNEILANLKVDQFFFVNYYNPDKCLRLRFKTNSQKNKEDIIGKIHELKNINLISNYHISLYDQEIHRYGGIRLMEAAEDIFNLDSLNVLMTIINGELNDDLIKMMAILKIKSYLEIFDFSLDEMIDYCEDSINMFQNEFDLTSDLRKSFNKEFLTIKFLINEFHFFNYLNNEKIKKSIERELDDKSAKKNYVSILIHMSMNRHFEDNQRFNEFRTYYLTKSFLNQIKFTKKG
ncbi:lantibiotic dehydratase [Flavobacterium sp. UBA7680]|uniref:lantibiotic dehydratase n=1 Tax=Flavobacterium sp. UBA7680 TaxID=1946559 RepID=UPI0025C17113|nr:lantibiotic dehydratase [Flavobacterium sp. UBA7680]